VTAGFGAIAAAALAVALATLAHDFVTEYGQYPRWQWYTNDLTVLAAWNAALFAVLSLVAGAIGWSRWRMRMGWLIRAVVAVDLLSIGFVLLWAINITRLR
jgi:hypothetical protein